MRFSVALVLAFVLSALGFQPAGVSGQQQRTFEVTAAIRAESLKSDVYRQNGSFWVDTEIRNLTSTDQQIIVWSQSGWSWLSDNPAISPDIAAQQNVSWTVVIKPAQIYKLSTDMVVNPRRGNPTTFRIGLYANAKLPISAQPDFAKLHKNEIAWSNPVTLMP